MGFVVEVPHLLDYPQCEVATRMGLWASSILAHCSILCHHEHCTCVYQGVLLSSCSKYLKQSSEFSNLRGILPTGMEVPNCLSWLARF